MRISRDKYLNDLVARKGNGMVKVVTGARRCGKTYLLFDLFEDHLRAQGVDDDHIIEIALDDLMHERYRDPLALYDYVRSRITNREEPYYVLLDEVQYAISDEEMRGEEPPRLYGVINGLLRMRNGLRRSQELDDLVDVLASSIGALTNPPKIKATFASVLHSGISTNTIMQYIGHLEDAFVIEEARRFDVKGRKYIGSPKKYYFEDMGLRNARLGFRQIEQTHIMENIVYNELRTRGYNVDVGVVDRRGTSEGVPYRKRLEVDFVANLGDRRCYIQSAYQLPTPEKVAQEKASLLEIDDSFQKIVLVRDVVKPVRDEHGILTMSVYDFLLDPDSLTM